MKIIKPSATLESDLNPESALKLIERAGRLCYRSENKIAEGSAEEFITRIIKRGHLSVIEHVSLSFRIVCSRACSHQIVRHRIASYSQMSQRYVKHTEELGVIVPPKISTNEAALKAYTDAMGAASVYYKTLVESGIPAEDARFVLPNAVATELIMTANLREWLHFIEVRGSEKAQWEIREIAEQVDAVIKTAFKGIFKEE